MAHSKAPWTYDLEGYDQYITVRSPGQRAAVARVSRARPEDASLIAAAPELLRAVEQLNQIMTEIMPQMGGLVLQDYGLLNKALINAETSIAKARKPKERVNVSS